MFSILPVSYAIELVTEFLLWGKNFSSHLHKQVEVTLQGYRVCMSVQDQKVEGNGRGQALCNAFHLKPVGLSPGYGTGRVRLP